MHARLLRLALVRGAEVLALRHPPTHREAARCIHLRGAAPPVLSVHELGAALQVQQPQRILHHL